MFHVFNYDLDGENQVRLFPPSDDDTLPCFGKVKNWVKVGKLRKFLATLDGQNAADDDRVEFFSYVFTLGDDYCANVRDHRWLPVA